MAESTPEPDLSLPYGLGIFERPQLQILLDSLPVLVGYVDRDLTYRFNNQKYAEWFQLDLSRITGRPVPDVMGSEIFARLEPHIRRALGGEQVTWEGLFAGGREVRSTFVPDRGTDGVVKGFLVLVEDLSEEHRTERRLRSSENHLRGVLDALFAFVGVLDPQGVLVQANRAPLQAAGILESDVVGKRFEDTYWWSYSEAAQQQIRNAIDLALRGEPSRFDIQARMANGVLMWIDFTMQPMWGPEGRVAFLIPSAVEITARKQVEEALRESEERFRATFEQAGVGIAHVGLHGEWLRVNQSLCDIVGYSKQELLSRTFQDITHPDDLSTDLAQAEALLAGRIERYSMEKRYLCKNGSVRWVSLTASLLRDRDASPRYFISVVQDIHARKQAEAASRRSDENLRQFTNSVPGVLFENGRNGQCRFLNRYWTDYTGLSLEESLGHGWHRAVHPEDLAAMQAKPLEMVAQEEPYDFEHRLRRHDGVYRWFAGRTLPLRDRLGGAITGWVGAALDIEGQKEAGHAVERANRQLQRANEDLRQFAYAASHDLQEPLRMVTCFTQLLAKRYEGQLGADADNFIRYAVGGARRIELLINGLRDYWQVAGREGSAALTSDTADILERALARLQPKLAASAALVTYDPLPVLAVPPWDLEQVLQHLVGNAVRYRNPERAPRIHISSVRDGDLWRISVRDNGVGIDPRYQALIFKIFRRLHADGEEGSGIGLALCQKIVERHGGHIWVESEPGRGSEFFFTAPAAASDSGTSSNPLLHAR